jgi:hypothetical protein
VVAFLMHVHNGYNTGLSLKHHFGQQEATREHEVVHFASTRRATETLRLIFQLADHS